LNINYNEEAFRPKVIDRFRYSERERVHAGSEDRRRQAKVDDRHPGVNVNLFSFRRLMAPNK